MFRSMEKIITKETGSVYGDLMAWQRLNQHIAADKPTKVFILTDEHTKVHCLPYFLQQLEKTNDPIVLTIKAGEAHKTIATCLDMWNQLSNLGADRNSLLINLGGGVVTDIGGFIACTYQRGIQFYNIPTSLLAMVDAAVGGKNGVDLGSLKNQIGIIKNPKAVIVDPYFLKTLPESQFTSGMAEMIKHGLVSSEMYLDQVFAMDTNDEQAVSELVWESICIKNEVITKDPLEKGLRKTLNFGHTLGHAIESYCLESNEKKTLLHGEAIAIGMILALYLSSEMYQFPKKTLEAVTTAIQKRYPKITFEPADIEAIIKLLIYDKKNSNGQIHFVLLENIGVYKLNCKVPNDLIYSAFKFYAHS